MQLSMAMSVGILFALALITASLAQTAERYAHTDMPILGQADEVLGMLLLRILSFVFNLAIFLILYKVLPTPGPIGATSGPAPLSQPSYSKAGNSSSSSTWTTLPPSVQSMAP